MNSGLLPFLAATLLAAVAQAQSTTANIDVVLNERLGPMEMDRFALGQGGLSPEPMWADRAAEIRALHPRLIRLFIQEYFDLLPEKGRYHFDTLDRSVDLILSTGAKPLMCIAFKPRVLFPKVDQDVVEPNDYPAWEELVSRLVQHYRERNAGIRYWEVMNEPDIGEDGGCPYRFRPDSYIRFYEHTAKAVLKADPSALVGGPALANSNSSLLPAFLDYCEVQKVPLGFVSWHIYSSEPRQVRATIDKVKDLLAKHPNLKPETILDEWNMALGKPPTDPRVQPCYIAEVAWQMKEGGLDHSCYYHIRDYHVLPGDFAPFMSPHGTAFMAAWWNRMPQFDGLFDFQNTGRPAYFTFKLLARLTGERLRVKSDSGFIHGFATYDERYQLFNVLVWNYSDRFVNVNVTFKGLTGTTNAKPLLLDAMTASDDENARLFPENTIELTPNNSSLETLLDRYGIRFWSFEPGK